MSTHWYIDFTGLLPVELQTTCEQEFQRQMNLTDGELFIWSNATFAKVDLSLPAPSSQAVLQFFSSCGCPICGTRLAISLYPHSSGLWPIRSTELAFRYLFSSLETLLNIRTDARVKDIICDFESSDIFGQARRLAQNFIGECCKHHNICPEVITYITNQAEPAVNKNSQLH